MQTVTHIDISPSKEKKCCQNCGYFSKWGVHLGICNKGEKGVEKMDYQRCRKFDLTTRNNDE